MDELSAAQSQFAKDRFATENGAEIRAIGDRYALCAMVLTEHHRNAMGGVMGGATFSLADFAFAVAANHQGMATPSVAADIRYLGTVKGATLLAETRLIKDGRSLCTYQVDVRDDLGTPVALVTITGIHLGGAS